MVLIFLMAAYLYDKHHHEVSSNCWKLHWCMWGQMIKTMNIFLFPSPPPPFPSLLFVFSFFSSSQAGMRNTLLTGAAHQTHRLYLSPGRVDRRLQSGVISALFTTIEFIARIKRWSTDKQSSITVPLARLLSFYRHESENFADFSLR